MKLKVSDLVNNIGQIKDVPANPRTINNDDYRKLLESIKEDPEYLEHEMPHVIKHGDKYVVLNGNQRLRALKELGFTETPVTIYKEDTPPEVIRSRIIKSNHGYGKDDMDLLANEWSDDPLSDWGLELPDSWNEPEEVEEDEAPEVSSEPPVSKLGSIYQLGRHRVMCGDSTDKASVELLMSGEKADLLLTDPPYGIDYGSQLIKGEEYKEKTNKHGWRNFGNPEWDINKPVNGVLSSMLILAKSSIIWGGNYFTDELPASQGWLIWDKGQRDFSLADGEMAWTSFDNALRIKEYPRAAANQEEKGHPTQKPQEIIKWCLDYAERHSKANPKVVIDLYLGSGSTLIACEQTDRTCYGMELDPKYVDVIRKRYHKFVTGDEEGWEDGTPAI